MSLRLLKNKTCSKWLSWSIMLLCTLNVSVFDNAATSRLFWCYTKSALLAGKRSWSRSHLNRPIIPLARSQYCLIPFFSLYHWFILPSYTLNPAQSRHGLTVRKIARSAYSWLHRRALPLFGAFCDLCLCSSVKTVPFFSIDNPLNRIIISLLK